jgi:RNA recognition motif-containing protein
MLNPSGRAISPLRKVVPLEAPSEVVSTLFVSGFPKDTRYREVFNLFRFEPGFEHCSFNGELDKNPTAWVRFTTVDYATRALQRLSGLNFDPNNEEDPHELRIQFAKKNSLRKQVKSVYDEFVAAQSRRTGTSASIVYLGNLGAEFSNEEISGLASELQGFRRIRFARTMQSQTPYAYIEFANTDSAAAAVDRLNKQVTSTSGPEGLRAEISKRGSFRPPTGKRNDGNRPGISDSQDVLTDDSDHERA